jgi:uncharacterized protein
MQAWDAQPDALVVRVRVTPKGGRDAIEGVGALSDGRSVMKVRVRAAPEHGAANEAVRRTLAKALGVAPSAVSLGAGPTARLETFRVTGDPAALVASLMRAIAAHAA